MSACCPPARYPCLGLLVARYRHPNVSWRRNATTIPSEEVRFPLDYSNGGYRLHRYLWNFLCCCCCYFHVNWNVCHVLKRNSYLGTILLGDTLSVVKGWKLNYILFLRFEVIHIIYKKHWIIKLVVSNNCNSISYQKRSTIILLASL